MADTDRDEVYVDKTKFFEAVTTLKNADPEDFHWFLDACEELKPLSIGDACLPSRHSHNYEACPRGATCRLNTTATTPSTYTCVGDKPLTKHEKAQAGNIFHALDVNHDRKISRKEFSDLLIVISDWAQGQGNDRLYEAVERSVYTRGG